MERTPKYIDENILETLKLLNKKGYHTLYSCAGHSVMYKNLLPSTYIMFADKLDFPTLPNSFEIEVCPIYPENRAYNDGVQYTTTIRKQHNNHLPSNELQMQIWKACLNILEWAEALEDRCLENQ